VFLSTFEKQLDAKRRIVVPQEFRAAAAGPFDGVFCFPSIEADCLDGGGQALFQQYRALVD
jgi:MraZ protein